ncbi:MAG: NADH:flavin oxidoreductase [Syntrophaceae bacterium]|nr:NADH:flavin oxidoreductase [Syntrophaceae bacterium]
MTQIFETSNIGSITLKNRIIRSATADGLADADGRPTGELIEFYKSLARGGAGAIITGFTGIQKNGKGSTHHPLMLDRDEYIDDYKKLTAAVHEYNTPIIIQLNHAGRQTRKRITGLPTVAPSARRDLYFLEKRPKKLTDSAIEEIITNFAKAIERAKKAGFDGVQLHCAHGFLLSEFLSSNMNKRKDQGGGTTKNKFRIIERIFTEARKRVGDFPILAKINAYDTRKMGMRTPEAVEIAKYLQDAGCAAIEVSCGVANDGFITVRSKKFPTAAALEYSYLLRYLPFVIKKFIQPFIPIFVPIFTKPQKQLDNFNVPAAEEIKKNVSIPVIVVGGIKRLDDIERIIFENKADYVSMSRAFICEPDIVNKFREKKQTESKCVSCNFCITCIESMPFKCFNDTR